MALCLVCGAIMHDDDRFAHTCREQDKPIKGIMKVQGKHIDIKTGLEV